LHETLLETCEILHTGHFTQLVWKSSREIGVGVAQSRDGKWFVVANFFPAGNIVGREAENVFPPRQAVPTARTTAKNATLKRWFDYVATASTMLIIICLLTLNSDKRNA
jgi:hypothetical protein